MATAPDSGPTVHDLTTSSAISSSKTPSSSPLHSNLESSSTSAGSGLPSHSTSSSNRSIGFAGSDPSTADRHDVGHTYDSMEAGRNTTANDHPSSTFNRSSKTADGNFSSRDPIAADQSTSYALNSNPNARDSYASSGIRKSSLEMSTEPLAVTAATEAVDQDRAPVSEHRGTVSQNAPGKAGTVGENMMGAFGYGGSTVERPKEDQGIAEKIVKFLGA